GPRRRIAILAHGYSSEGAAMGGFGRYYRDELGFSVLMPDARGHGASEGDYIGFGWHERLDYLRWIDWVVAREGPDCEIILHGISMGGATVLMTGGEALPPQVRAIVSDCAYTSAYEELAYQLKRMYRLGDKPFLPATSRLTQRRAGYGFEEASALEQVKKAKVPILFIHGGADTFVPTEMVYRLAEACPTVKVVFIVPNAGHGLAWTADPEGYRRTLKAFLDRWS
ncbi:MAG: alpha/beta hydrolase, partial [Spirochaetaceae bacterium]|nr:alpha/beta hydrolase [Spirochaetaceae bacterium]